MNDYFDSTYENPSGVCGEVRPVDLWMSRSSDGYEGPAHGTNARSTPAAGQELLRSMTPSRCCRPHSAHSHTAFSELANLQTISMVLTCTTGAGVNNPEGECNLGAPSDLGSAPEFCDYHNESTCKAYPGYPGAELTGCTYSNHMEMCCSSLI
jgi:hypothetical protein